MSKKIKIVILPIGSIEQHGPHLGFDVDFLLADKFSKHIYDETSKNFSDKYDISLLPTIPFGVAEEHMKSGNTISISNLTLYNYLSEILNSTTKSFRPNIIIIYNSHGGNMPILNVLSTEYNYRNRSKVSVYSHFNSRVEKEMEEIFGTGESHAGSFESSSYFYFKGELTMGGKTFKNSGFRKKISGGLKLFRMDELSDTGIINDTDEININFEGVEKIKIKIYEDFVIELEKVINNMLKIYGQL